MPPLVGLCLGMMKYSWQVLEAGLDSQARGRLRDAFNFLSPLLPLLRSSRLCRNNGIVQGALLLHPLQVLFQSEALCQVLTQYIQKLE